MGTGSQGFDPTTFWCPLTWPVQTPISILSAALLHHLLLPKMSGNPLHVDKILFLILSPSAFLSIFQGKSTCAPDERGISGDREIRDIASQIMVSDMSSDHNEP